MYKYAKNQLNSFIHSFTNKSSVPISDPDLPKNIKAIFNFPEFQISMHKICLIHPIILVIQPILQPHNLQEASAILDHAYPIIICYSEIVSHVKNQFVPLIR